MIGDHRSSMHPADPPPRRLPLAVALTGAMAFSVIAPFALGALAPHLVDDLGVSRSELGAVIAGCYAAAALLSRYAGRAVDRLPARQGLALVFVASAAALAVIASSTSYWALWLVVVPAGIAAASGNPATNRVVSQIGGRPGILIGLKQSGVQVAALLAGSAVTVLAALLGWRLSLVSVGVVAVAAVGLARWIPAFDGAGSHRPAAMPSAMAGFVRSLSLYAFLMGAGMATVTAYVALYARDTGGFEEATAGLLLAMLGAGGIAARVSWSIEADRRDVAPRGLARRLQLLAGAAVAVSLLLIAAETWSASLYWISAAGIGLTAAAWNALATLALVRSIPGDLVGEASGRMLTAFFGGLALTPLLFGAVVDAAGSYTPGWLITVSAFLLALLAGGRLVGRVPSPERPPEDRSGHEAAGG